VWGNIGSTLLNAQACIAAQANVLGTVYAAADIGLNL